MDAIQRVAIRSDRPEGVIAVCGRQCRAPGIEHTVGKRIALKLHGLARVVGGVRELPRHHGALPEHDRARPSLGGQRRHVPRRLGGLCRGRDTRNHQPTGHDAHQNSIPTNHENPNDR